METLHACSQKEENDMCHILYALAAPCDLHLTRCYVCIFGKMTLMHLNSRQRTLCLWSVIISKFSWLSVCTLPNLWKHTPAFQTNNGSTAQISPHQQVRHCTRWQRQGIKLSRSAGMELAVLPDGWKGDSTKNCFCSQGGFFVCQWIFTLNPHFRSF